MARDEALLLHNPDDIKFVLNGSPDPFASDLEPKRKGDGSVSARCADHLPRGDLGGPAEVRRVRSGFDKPLHRLAQAFVNVAKETAEQLATETIRWQNFNAAFQRLTRRVVFGDRAADDTQLTETLIDMMSAGNKLPGEPAP